MEPGFADDKLERVFAERGTSVSVRLVDMADVARLARDKADTGLDSISLKRPLPDFADTGRLMDGFLAKLISMRVSTVWLVK